MGKNNSEEQTLHFKPKNIRVSNCYLTFVGNIYILETV